MNRAYSTIQIKAMSEDGGKRKFSGVASTPSTDRMGDIIEPKGMKIRKDTPLLWQHDSRDPIGWVRSAKVTDDGIEVECEVASVDEDGPLKDRLTLAWQMLKAKLVRGLSIGFNSIESARIDGTYGYRFSKTELLELSAVTIPANADCSIHSIKSIDKQHLAALGREWSPPGDRTRPGASGQQQQAASGRLFQSRSQKGNEMKTLKELRELRTTKAARLQELVELFKADDHEATEDETGEFDSLSLEVKELDQDIRIAGFHAMQAATAKSVDGSSSAAASASRGGMSFVRKQDPEDKYKGESFTRIQIAKAVALLTGESPSYIAEKRWGKSHPKLVQVVKAAVAGGGTGSGEWFAELAESDSRYTGDFIEFLYGMTVYDKLNLRSVPGRIKVKGQDGAFTGYWVGESKAIPMSKGDASSVELLPLKVAGLTVISMELLEDSQPAAEMLVRDGLAEAISQRVDQTFLSATAASAGVSPAGLLNGVTAIQASGTDLAAVRADLQALLYPFVSNKMASGITLAMNPATAMAIGLMYGALDQLAYPTINQTGGTLNGMPVVVGDNVTPGQIIAIRTQDVWRIGDSGIRISMSREATIEQQDDPSGATDTPTGVTTTNLTNMFQEESVAFKVVRRINFQKRRTAAVTFIENAEYGGVVS
jgi:HK97 family phage major capsid protein/HK97 family phage prohead protease